MALLFAATRFGLEKAELEQALPRVADVPFTPERKRMTTIHPLTEGEQIPQVVSVAIEGDDSPYLAFTKGSTETLLNLCSTVWVNGESMA